MKNQKINPATVSTYKTISKMRGDWGNINPVTKVIHNRKREYQFPDSYYDYDDYDEYESHYNRDEDEE